MCSHNPRERKNRVNGEEEYKEKMATKFPKPMKNTNPQIKKIYTKYQRE